MSPHDGLRTQNMEISELVHQVLHHSIKFSTLVQNGHSTVISDCEASETKLTDYRLNLASRVLKNIFSYKDDTSLIFISTKYNNSSTLVVGPVINPMSGTKDTTTSLNEYMELRKKHIKCRGTQPSENAIANAVISYDLLRNNLTKPIQAIGMIQSKEIQDHSFCEAVKVIYNRSRVLNILHKFEAAIRAQIYSALPDHSKIDFNLLRCAEEQNLLKKYVATFFPMINQWKVEQAAELPSKLWRFLLLLSQDYSVYYGRHRALCDQSPEVMFARIWLQKCVLAIYDCGFCLLDIEPVNYM